MSAMSKTIFAAPLLYGTRTSALYGKLFFALRLTLQHLLPCPARFLNRLADVVFNPDQPPASPASFMRANIATRSPIKAPMMRVSLAMNSSNKSSSPHRLRTDKTIRLI